MNEWELLKERLEKLEVIFEQNVDRILGMSEFKKEIADLKLKESRNYDNINELRRQISVNDKQIEEFGLDNDYLKKGGLVEQLMERIEKLEGA